MSFSRGPGTLSISAQLFVKNRERLVSALRGNVAPGSVVFLQGGVEKNRYNTDAEDLPFRQESYFFWTFGVHESECFGAIDVDSGRSWFFPPTLHPSYAIWDGKIEGEEFFKIKYDVDKVNFHDNAKNISELLSHWKPSQLLLLRAENSDSDVTLEPPQLEGFKAFLINTEILYPVMAELRIEKTDLELEVMRYSSAIACLAHKAVMKHIRPGHFEYQMESLFRHKSYYDGGCRHLAYTCIAASGENGAILHYGHANAPNNKEILTGDMCLFDMGPEYNCYCSDVTTSFPVGGKFSEKQKIIYNAVLDANRTVFEAARPGVRWTDMHLLAEQVLLSHLKEAGLVIGDVNEMVSHRIGAVFMPHGLGHLIGLDVHDVGGYLADALPRSTLAGLKSLRTTRRLKERMVITIEPGCYFIDTLLEKAYRDSTQTAYLVKERIDEFKKSGGVRIEDCVVIGANGIENLSWDLPRTVKEIEDFMAETADHSCCQNPIKMIKNSSVVKKILFVLLAILIAFLLFF